MLNFLQSAGKRGNTQKLTHQQIKDRIKYRMVQTGPDQPHPQSIPSTIFQIQPLSLTSILFFLI
jgi:hypothetical protein